MGPSCSVRRRDPASHVTDVGDTRPCHDAKQRTSDAHRYPQFLPDGERFLYLHLTGTEGVGGVYISDLNGAAPLKVLDGQDSALYTQTSTRAGYLLFRRRDTLMAQPFDPVNAKNTGPMFPVIEGVGQSANTGFGAMSVSATGDIVTWAGGLSAAELTWIDRSGRRGSAAAPAAEVAGFAVSRDGGRPANAITSGAATDLWTVQLPGGTPSKFTFGPAPGWAQPTLSPDGSEIAYATVDYAGLSKYELRRKKFDMTGREETLATSEAIMWLWDWALDGSYLVYNATGALWQLPLETREGIIAATSRP